MVNGNDMQASMAMLFKLLQKRKEAKYSDGLHPPLNWGVLLDEQVPWEIRRKVLDVPLPNFGTQTKEFDINTVAAAALAAAVEETLLGIDLYTGSLLMAYLLISFSKSASMCPKCAMELMLRTMITILGKDKNLLAAYLAPG